MSDQMVIFGVSADPDPHGVNTIANGQRPVMQADSRGPELTDLLDLQCRVPRILKHLFLAAGRPIPASRRAVGGSSPRILASRDDSSWRAVSVLGFAADFLS